MPGISIIVPIYQPPIKYLRKCIDSIINQELKDIEIILILDGSSKEIENIVKEYQENDNRIKCFIQENMGESITRNKAIQLATADWICFVDSDDWIEKETLKYIYQKIKKGDNSDIIIFDCIVEYKEDAIKNTAILTSTVMINIEKIDKRLLEMPDIRLGQDSATWWQILKTGITAYGLKENFTYYRRRKKSLSYRKIVCLIYTWKLYRKIEKMDLPTSIYYYINYFYNAIKKRII